MQEPLQQHTPGTPRSESKIPLSLFEVMSRWYFGGSEQKEPPASRMADTVVTISDAWMGILCLSYYGNGPRHPSTGFSGGIDVPPKDSVVQYAQVKERIRMIPGGYAARKANNGERPNQIDQGSAGSSADYRPARGPGDESVVLPPSDLASSPLLPNGGPPV